MMNRVSLFFLCFFSYTILGAQELVTFNQERLDLTQKGMLVLGSWAGANILLSPILAGNASGSTKFFHQMNGYWNAINLIIAGFGYYSAVTGEPSGFTLGESIVEQQKIEKLLLFNAGLDVAYVLGGLYLVERSKRVAKNSDRFKGFGRSVMLQGAFLFAFDVGFYLFQHAHGRKLPDIVDGLALGPTGFILTVGL